MNASNTSPRARLRLFPENVESARAIEIIVSRLAFAGERAIILKYIDKRE